MFVSCRNIKYPQQAIIFVWVVQPMYSSLFFKPQFCNFVHNWNGDFQAGESEEESHGAPNLLVWQQEHDNEIEFYFAWNLPQPQSQTGHKTTAAIPSLPACSFGRISKKGVCFYHFKNTFFHHMTTFVIPSSWSSAEGSAFSFTILR